MDLVDYVQRKRRHERLFTAEQKTCHPEAGDDTANSLQSKGALTSFTDFNDLNGLNCLNHFTPAFAEAGL